MTDQSLQALARRIDGGASGHSGSPGELGFDARPTDGEIFPISTSFNGLQDSISLAWERQNPRDHFITDSLVAIISKTLQGTIIGWTLGATEMFGYTEGEMIGRSIAILIPDDRLGEETAILAKISKGTRVANYQTVRRRKNGELFPISVTISPIRDPSGTIIGASKIAQDITEGVRAREALKLAEERFELVVAAMSLGVWDWDMRRGVSFRSARLQSLVGSAPRAGVRTIESFVESVHPDDSEAVAGRLRAHLERGEKFEVDYRLRKGDGSYIWVRAAGQAIYDEAGTPVRMVGSCEDISRRKQLESELRRMVEKLEKSNKELDEFAYAASHDLKAPLRVIDNASQWLMEDLEPHLTDETREHMALLRSRVKRMEKLLADLLQYSRIGRTQDEQYAESVKGGELLENIVSLLSPKAGYSVTADAGFAGMTVARMPLQQVLMNLIDNAIKHHDKAEGTVTLSMEDEGEHYAFSVADDGPGIPAQFQDKVFDMFRTLKPRDQVEGSGMGLAMVRKNIETFGGVITLRSSPGHGCQFRFTWPKANRPRMPEA